MDEVELGNLLVSRKRPAELTDSLVHDIITVLQQLASTKARLAYHEDKQLELGLCSLLETLAPSQHDTLLLGVLAAQPIEIPEEQGHSGYRVKLQNERLLAFYPTKQSRGWAFLVEHD